MKKQFLSFLILILCAFSVFGQSSEAEKIDEFGNTNCDDYRVRLDNLLISLNEFHDARGYVYIYEGDLKQFVYDKNNRNVGTKYVQSEAGIAKGLIGYFQNHLSFRNFPEEKITFVEAGFREKFTVELWIVPKEVDAPQPTPTLKKLKQRKPKRNPFGFCGEL